MIQPTIGRRVWYWPSNADRDGQMAVIDSAQACDAGVVFVHGDRRVNLIVTDHIGNTFSRLQVQLLQDDDVAPEKGHTAFAEWMPYQRDAAKPSLAASAPAISRNDDGQPGFR